MTRFHSAIFILTLASVCQPAVSQTLSTDDVRKNWLTDFRAGLNNDGYQFDFGLAYFPIQYVGIKAQLGACGEIEEFGDWGKDESETGHTYATRFKFTPAIVLRSPGLVHWKSQDARLYVFAESGLYLSPGASGSKGAVFFSWDFKAGINLQFDRFVFSIGYGATDFSLYSGVPTSHWGPHDNNRYITHSGFVGGAYLF